MNPRICFLILVGLINGPLAFGLDESDRTYERDRVSPAAHIAGILFSIVPGFGLGQTIQGRWEERGMYFALGEAACFGAMYIGAKESSLDPGLLFTAGALGFLSLKAMEIADALVGPSQHNERLREKAKATSTRGAPWGVLPFGPSASQGVTFSVGF